MRLESEPRSDFYWKKFFTDMPEVLLDGKPIEHVQALDTVDGWVKVIKHVNNYPVDAGGRYVTETFMGKVEVTGNAV